LLGILGFVGVGVGVGVGILGFWGFVGSLGFGSCGGGTGLPFGLTVGGGLFGGTMTVEAGFFFFFGAQPSITLPIKNTLKNKGTTRDNINISTATVKQV
jgi:hypothetical protein